VLVVVEDRQQDIKVAEDVAEACRGREARVEVSTYRAGAPPESGTADVLVFAPAELPIGIVTSFCTARLMSSTTLARSRLCVLQRMTMRRRTLSRFT
jgi:hypothetical protein